MKIDLSYQGACSARMKNTVDWQAYADSMAGKEIEVSRNGQSVKLTFSNELIRFKDYTDEVFLMDIHAQNGDPNDIFSYKPKDQWLVFSQYLSETKYFDSYDAKEITEIESALQKITDGLDTLPSQGINFFGGIKSQLDSYEAPLELAASSIALAAFSQKYLSGDIKNGFDELISQYTEHNAKKAVNHHSLEENFYGYRSKVHIMNVSKEQTEDYAITEKLSKKNYSETEISGLVSSYTEMFKNIGPDSDLQQILQQAREHLVDSATKDFSNDPHYGKARDYVNQRADDTFQRIAEYLSPLLTK
ncbi:hypothetical protein [Fontibacillus sp. BL9]|uniref:hypothetical protein n=1 Tax=Fontibacillus sp. BL9 TaxID=3389971 RepID=UPI00397E6D52